MELGARLKEYRNNHGMTQDELAERLYVTRQTISSWENDKSYPDIHSLLMLGEVFDVSLDTLVKGDIEIMKEKVSPSTRPRRTGTRTAGSPGRRTAAAAAAGQAAD